MAKKAKTAKKKPKDIRPQKQRFLEAARKAVADETGEELDRVIGKLFPPRRKPKR